MKPSRDDETKFLPFPIIARSVIRSLCDKNVLGLAPDAISHILILKSKDAVNPTWHDGKNNDLVTSAKCASSIVLCKDDS